MGLQEAPVNVETQAVTLPGLNLFEHFSISLTVLHTLGDPAQGSGGNVGLFNYLVIGFSFQQKLCGMGSFCHFFNFLACTQIIEKSFAVFHILQL